MKRTAIVLGIAAALFVAPTAAQAGNITTQVHKVQVHKVQVHKAQVVSTQRVSAAVTAQRVSVQRVQAQKTPREPDLRRAGARPLDLSR